jgi:DNA-binding CsgD family transcriptional regulator
MNAITQDRTGFNLTPTQRVVADYLAEGVSNKEIANRLGICEGTVKVHVKGLLAKLGVSNRTKAAMVWSTGVPPSALMSGMARLPPHEACSLSHVCFETVAWLRGFHAAMPDAALPAGWTRLDQLAELLMRHASSRETQPQEVE